MNTRMNLDSRTAFWPITLFFAGMMVRSLMEHIPDGGFTAGMKCPQGTAEVGTVLVLLWLLFCFALLGRRESLNLMAGLVPLVLAGSIIFAALLALEQLQVQRIAFEMVSLTVCWAACILQIRLQDWLESKVAEMYPSQPGIPPDNTVSNSPPAGAKREAPE